jgi:NAD(P)-dependent dehydrogenase (short-subunit alcohol dehydrogenase family)
MPPSAALVHAARTVTKIKGSVVVITGAASGLGRSLAQEFASRGARLALADVDENGLQTTATSLPADCRCTTHVVDVRSRAHMQAWARELLSLHGGVDILINNAGIAVRGDFEQLTYEQLERVFDVNLWGVIHGVKALLPALHRSPFAHIVNIASVNSFVPLPQNAAYNMAKSAVLGLSETLMQELAGTTIRVTCVHPGAIRTNLVRNSEGFTDAQVSYFDRFAKTSSEYAARAIASGVERNKDYLLIGRDAWLMALGRWLAPRKFVRMVGERNNHPTLARGRSSSSAL